MATFPATGAGGADHLLISEVLIDPPGGSGTENHETSAEFVEIYNPTSAQVALQDVIITDYSAYHLLPAGSFDYVTHVDYMLAFPTTATLAPGQLAVVTLDAETFFAEAGTGFGGTAAGYYAQPGAPLLFEIRNSDPAVPEMVNMKAGAPDPYTFLKSNSGEFVAMITWNGQSDLVSDIDIVQWGSPIGSAIIVNKSGVEIEGPDTDGLTSTYKIDARPDHFNLGGTVEAMARTSTDEIFELSSNGNGLTGHDETTENLAATFVSRLNTQVTPGLPHPDLAPARVTGWQLY